MKLLRPSTKGRLAEVIGHELRNPLASAVASVSVSLEMTDADDPRAGFLQQAIDDLSRVSTLLTSYLEIGRSGELAHQNLDLVEVVRRVCRRYECHNALVDLEAGSRPVRLRGDPMLLERLVENLVENALAMGATHVDLFVECEGEECIMHVSDNGPGVPMELRDTLFESSVSGRGSSGLGLALAKDIVESHNGSITLVSSVVGAMFRISLPRA